jgi:hypothetical protein
VVGKLRVAWRPVIAVRPKNNEFGHDAAKRPANVQDVLQ